LLFGICGAHTIVAVTTSREEEREVCDVFVVPTPTIRSISELLNSFILGSSKNFERTAQVISASPEVFG
jgi:hypothetical protein